MPEAVLLETGSWREGRWLVLSAGAELPAVCVKCGAPAEVPRLKKKMYWHSPWLYILIFFGLLPYAVAATIVRKRMDLWIPLCSVHKQRYRTLRAAGFLLLIGGVLAMVFLSALASPDNMGYAILSGIAIVLFGAVFLATAGGTLRPVYIGDQYGRFRGVSESFLAQLPPLPPTVKMKIPR